MPATVFGPQATVLSVYQLLNGRAPANATFTNQVGFATQFGEAAYAAALTQSLQGQTNQQVATTVVKNAGIVNQGVVDYVAAVLGSFGPSARGQVIINLANKLAGFEGDVNFGTAAAAFNNSISTNLSYSTNVNNTTDSAVGANNGNEAGSNLVLTTGQDIVTGTAGADFFRAVAGVAINAQDQTTLNSSDILDGGAGADTLIVNLNGNYGGGARIRNIETLQLGTNVLGGVVFDYNVNAGQNEVTEVTKIVADQINVGEQLSINNLIKTSTTTGTTTTAALPTLSWINDSVSRDAGTVVANYRGAQVVGTGNTLTTGTPSATAGDTQAVQLQSVEKGVLNINAGIETITIESLGTERVTLNNASAAFQETAGSVNSNVADVVSNGTLTRVALSGTAEIGKLAGVAATTGLTDRALGSDFGVTATGALGNGTGSNLLSVESRVTEVDASAATAAVNVRFVNKFDNSATDVVFKGGAGNDYAEFELGNVSATGGAGADTFAFITAAAGVTNSTFGAGDSLVGGAGADTIQLGLNGVGVFNVAQSEFANKSGFETLDLRGATNNVTLTGSFVASADTGTVMTVRTDKIVQTSLTSSANAAGSSFAEDNAVSTIDLSFINAGQALNFIGGSGSDRIIVSDATATGQLNLDGGTNVANNGTAVAGAGDYDTITLINGGILDRADLANIKGFEGLVLAKNTTGGNNFRVELTTAFVLNNTQSTNAVETSIDDTVFHIGTAVAANGLALTATDIVTIDISDLLNGTRTALATTLAGRGIDVAVAPATVNYVVDGVAATAAQIALITKADGNRADLLTSAANAPTPAAPTFTGTAGADTYTLQAATDSVALLAGADTLNTGAIAAPTGNLNGGDGADTINVTNAINLSGATISNFETLAHDANTVTATAAQLSSFTTAITGAGAITVSGAGSFNDTAASTSNAYVLSGAGNTFTANAAVTYNITTAAGAGSNTVVLTAGFTTADTINFTAGTGTADRFVLGYDTGVAIDLNGTPNTLQGVEQFASTTNQSGGAITLDTALTTVDLSAQTTALALTATGVTFNSLRLGASNDTINTLVTGGSATTAATVDLGAGNDLIQNLSIGGFAATITFGAGNDTIADIAAHGAGAATLKFAAPGAVTQALNIAATTVNLSINDVLDFATNVTSVINGVANGTLGTVGGIGQLFVDTTSSANNTIITFDADGSRTFNAGDVQVTIVGNTLGFGINAAGDAIVTASA